MNLKIFSIVTLSAILVGVVILKTRVTTSEAESAASLNVSPPFANYKTQAPGVTRKITLADLPKPYATESVDNGADVVRRPSDAWPQAPAGFKVEQFASKLDNPRLLRTVQMAMSSWPKATPVRSRSFVALPPMANLNRPRYSLAV